MNEGEIVVMVIATTSSFLPQYNNALSLIGHRAIEGF